MSEPTDTINKDLAPGQAHGSLRSPQRTERVRWLLSVSALAALLLGLYAVLEPFLVSLTWAAIFVLTTWPLHRALLRRFPRRPVLVAASMTLFLALILVAAVGPLIAALSGEAQSFASQVTQWAQKGEIVIPESIRRIPFLGHQLEQHLMSEASSREEVMALVKEYQGSLIQIASVAARGIFEALIKMLICLFAAFFIYLHGASLAQQVTSGMERLGGSRFGKILEAIRGTVRGAVYGVVVTAFAQGFLAGIGYWVAGAPTPLLLGFATTVMSLIPFGTPLVYIPVAGYLLVQGEVLAGVLLFAWGVGVVSMADNILRPFFISQATQMPILLVFMGVVGGVLSFGLLGIFVGPAIIAVAQVLWVEWVEGSSQSHGAEVSKQSEQQGVSV
jgi:predicted PurR-regulated permease PerM